MVPRRYIRRAAATVLAAGGLLAAIAPGAAALELRDSRIAASCDVDAAAIACRYRYLAEGAPSSVRLTVGGRPVAGAVHTPYPPSGATTAVLFLVDTSDPARGATVRRSMELVNDLAARAKPHHRLGLAHFDSDLYVSAPLGSSSAEIRRAGISLLADGTSSELYRNLLSAIKILARYQADRRAIVIISAGVADDTAYFPEDVVQAARADDIALVGVGIAESAEQRPHLQSLRRLAEETVSPFIEVRNGRLPSGFAADPFASLDSGGAIRAPLTDALRAALARAPLSLVLELPSGVRLSVSGAGLTGPGPGRGEGLAEGAGDRPRPERIAPRPPSVRSGSGASRWPHVLGGALVVVAGLALYAWSRRRSRRRGADSRPGPREPRRAVEQPEIEELTFSDDLPLGGATGGDDGRPSTGILGYLELRRPPPEPPAYYPITSSAFRMGRSSDNDLTLKDPSVSRHHAEIHMHRDGSFTVKDLESMNGVYVNDRRVRRSAKLNEGDRLELGDLSLTFTFRAPEPTGEETLVLSERDLTVIDLDFSGKGAA